jgi:hypothetical protein
MGNENQKMCWSCRTIALLPGRRFCSDACKWEYGDWDIPPADDDDFLDLDRHRAVRRPERKWPEDVPQEKPSNGDSKTPNSDSRIQ